MARRSPAEAVLTAVIAQLDTQTTSDSYTIVPQGTPTPYVKVGLVAAHRQDTMGRFGAMTAIDCDSVTAGPSQVLGVRMRNAVIQALNNRSLAMSGHTWLGARWEEDEYFPEMVNGIEHHHHIASFEIWTQQSSS